MQRLQLFGRPQLLDGEDKVEITSRKGLALLAYLSLAAQGEVSRDELAALLWPDVEDGRSRANLRNLLYELNKTPLADWLTVGSEAVGLQLANKAIDVCQFLACVDQGDLETAVAHYHGPFLQGFYLSNNDPFAEWQQMTADRLQQKMISALAQLGETAVAQQNYEQAEQYARQQIELDNLQESAWRQLVWAQTQNGQREQALNSYNELCQLLFTELAIEPAPETVALVEQIRQQQVTTAKGSITQTQPRPKAERILLEKVNAFWIDGVLEQSLHGEALLELGMETHPDALAYPWGMMLQRPSQPAQTLPAQTHMIDLFAESGHALLILGDPGSGKTTMLLDLARTAIEAAHENRDQPIPVVFNLSSWAQAERPLTDWLVDELNDKYLIPPNISREWLRQDQLLLLLDGLDEVKANRQAACVQAINQFRQAHGLAQVVVCSRLQEYEAVGEKLRLDTAVILQPLTPEQIDTYLQAGGERLTAVRSTLAQDATLRQMAQSPLLLSIMTLAYRDLAPEVVQEASSFDARRQHLFESYVKQMSVRKGESLRYSFTQTKQWLSWLAKQLQQEDQSIFLLDMLQPSWLNGRLQPTSYILSTRIIAGLFITLLLAVQREVVVLGLFMGCLAGILTAVQFRKQKTDSGWRYPLPFGKTLIPIWLLLLSVLGYGLFIGGYVEGVTLSSGVIALFFSSALFWAPFGILLEWRDGRRTASSDIETVEVLTWSWPKARRSVSKGVAVGTAVSLLVGVLLGLTTPEVDLWSILWPILLLFGLPMGISVGLLNGFTRDVAPLKTTPDQGFRLTLRFVLGGALFGAIAMSLIMIFFAMFVNQQNWTWLEGLQAALFGAWLGFKFGVGVGLWFGGLDLIYHAVLRLWFYRQEGLPIRLIVFLDDAVHHLYLRKVGNGYIFAHQLLLAYFADLDKEMGK